MLILIFSFDEDDGDEDDTLTSSSSSLSSSSSNESTSLLILLLLFCDALSLLIFSINNSISWLPLFCSLSLTLLLRGGGDGIKLLTALLVIALDSSRKIKKIQAN